MDNETGAVVIGGKRCKVCDWPIAASREEGCVEGDCAYRPSDPAEQARIRERRATLAAGIDPHAPRTTPDTSAEVERIRALRIAADALPCRQRVKPLGRICKRCGADASSACAGGSVVGIQIVDPLLARIATLETELEEARFLADDDELSPVSLALGLPTHTPAEEAAAHAARIVAERDALAARLPSPAAVRQARLVAAEIVETHVEDARPMSAAYDALPTLNYIPRQTANVAARHIRDRARMHRGTRDEGGDVDHLTLLVCAEDVDGCTTLGELEALIAKWREVSGG